MWLNVMECGWAWKLTLKASISLLTFGIHDPIVAFHHILHIQHSLPHCRIDTLPH